MLRGLALIVSVSQQKQLHMDLKIQYVTLGATTLSLRAVMLSLRAYMRGYQRMGHIGVIL